jgi:hypothetical protein
MFVWMWLCNTKHFHFGHWILNILMDIEGQELSSFIYIIMNVGKKMKLTME